MSKESEEMDYELTRQYFLPHPATKLPCLTRSQIRRLGLEAIGSFSSRQAFVQKPYKPTRVSGLEHFTLLADFYEATPCEGTRVLTCVPNWQWSAYLEKVIAADYRTLKGQ